MNRYNPWAMSSPMMQQYEAAKRACPDALLLFRMGDFYELFYDDAVRAAEVLQLTLTSREKGANAIPMAGFPHHQLESYLAKIVAAGLRAAVCEQVEDAKQAKGLVKREVVRVVSRGTLTESALLDPRECNYLAAVVCEEPAGLAWVELSTGRFEALVCPRERLGDELARISPAECLVAEEATAPPLVGDRRPTLTRRPPWAFLLRSGQDALDKQFGTRGVEGFGFDLQRDAAALRAAGAILDYLNETQRGQLGHIERLLPYRQGEALEIDPATRASLELARTLRDGRREGSLVWVLDRTVSPLGARLVGQWLSAPLRDRAAIDERLDAVEELVAESGLAEALRESLRQVQDVERLIGRVATGRATPRDLAGLTRTLRLLPAIKARLTARRSARLAALETELDLCVTLRAQLDAALEDECPLTSREGGFIRAGFRGELDQLRELAAGGKQWIANYQAEEAQRSGIANLKVGFHRVFGYYLEISQSQLAKVPERYIRKQTVKNAERYITPELKEYEERVLTADQRASELEHQLFCELRDCVAAQMPKLQQVSRVLAELDALAGFAELARQRGYCRPTLVDDRVLRIVEGRHPVLDLTEPAGTFVPNDVRIEEGAGPILLVTGPNMAGKSTYIRQVALAVIMAQVGSFVPAREAVIGLADRVFARVGASDELARGRSTFMVEMTETARILNTASERSVVILDEVGRGTSTYDGLSLAWAIVEYLHDRIGCRTLFATHYHELTDLERTLAGVKNLNVAVREWQDEVIFLHRIVDGAADKSYGIHVARLAGVPREALERAKDILARLEEEHTDAEGRPRIAGGRRSPPYQLTLFEPVEHPLFDTLRSIDVDRLPPLEALRLVAQWRGQLVDGKRGARGEG